MPEINCDPDALAKAAACFCYENKKVSASVIIYLLAQIAGDTPTPDELARKAACMCINDVPTREAVLLYLLCNIVNL